MSTATAPTHLERARSERLARVKESLDQRVETILNLVGLSEDDLSSLSQPDRDDFGTADVGPAAREKLKGIIKRLAGKAHAFTTCLRDLRKHQPGWSEDRRKRTCNVLKTMAKGSAANHSFSLSEPIHVSLDADVLSLLDMADLDVAEEVAFGGVGFALSAKQRKRLPASAFVYPREKRYPINDRKHAANALARSSGKPEEARVRAAVCKKFPDMPACEKSKKGNRERKTEP